MSEPGLEPTWYATCLRCGGEMKVGFLVDEGYGEKHVASWIEGQPERNWMGLKLKRKRKLPLAAHRCADCGFVDLYAPEG